MTATHYDVLGIPRHSDSATLRTTYRRLSLQWHPDRNPPKHRAKAEERFKHIVAAYECLSDADRRRQYDAELDFSFQAPHSARTPRSSAPAPYATSPAAPSAGADGMGRQPASYYAPYWAGYNPLASYTAAMAAIEEEHARRSAWLSQQWAEAMDAILGQMWAPPPPPFAYTSALPFPFVGLQCDPYWMGSGYTAAPRYHANRSVRYCPY